MIWGQWDGSGLRGNSVAGRGQLACWEHYNTLARYALMADDEQIHSGTYPFSFGATFSPSTDLDQHSPARVDGYQSTEKRLLIAHGAPFQVIVVRTGHCGRLDRSI
jgi:hypothetical protein